MKKGLLRSALAVLLVFSLLIIPSAGDVNAEWAVKPLKYKKNVTAHMYTAHAEENEYGIDLGKRDNKAKKVILKSSKKGVITDLDWISGYAVFRANKEGKTVLTITVRNKNGSTKKYKVNVTVKKVASPIKSIKIDKTDYTKKLSKNWKVDVRCKGKTVRIKIKPRKGWKVSKLQYDAEYFGDDEDVNGVYKSYNNNDTIKLVNSADYKECVEFTMTEKATGFNLMYTIIFETK